MKLARIPSTEASAAIPWLLSADLVDRGAKIVKEAGNVLVPLQGDIGVLEHRWEILEGFTHVRDVRSPQQKVFDDIRIPEEMKTLLPLRWEFVGHIAVLKMDPALNPWQTEIGRSYAQALNVSTVCVDRGGVRGEFRQPRMEVIHGHQTESVRLENGIRYLFDVTKVMFASGNVDERERMARLDCRGETVLDMFSGIGYFTLPIAKFAHPDKVVACEKNPESYEYLLRNIALNGVQDKVEPVLGDNRDLPDKAFAHRILMGYVHRTKEFLPKALKLLLPGGMLHYHENYYVREARESVDRDIAQACDGRTYEIVNLREVKSYAPSVSHYVADVVFH